MFARFQQRRTRINVSILESHRVNGRMTQEHIANLGSVETPPSARSRIYFWRGCLARMKTLSNRIGPDEENKIVNQIHKRIPAPTAEEIAALNGQEARNEEIEAWDEIRRGWQDVSDLHARKIKHYEDMVARQKPGVAAAQEFANDVPDIQSKVASGKISAVQSARLRQEQKRGVIQCLGAIAGMRLKNKKNEEPPISSLEKWMHEEWGKKPV